MFSATYRHESAMDGSACWLPRTVHNINVATLHFTCHKPTVYPEPRTRNLPSQMRFFIPAVLLTLVVAVASNPLEKRCGTEKDTCVSDSDCCNNLFCTSFANSNAKVSRHLLFWNLTADWQLSLPGVHWADYVLLRSIHRLNSSLQRYYWIW